MQSTVKYLLTCTFLCVTFLTKAQFEKADSLKAAGNFKIAALEYERVVYQNLGPEIINKALLYKGLCLKTQGKFNEAFNTFNRANLFLVQDSLNFRIRYELSLAAYLSDNYPAAQAQLTQIEYFFKDNGYNDVLYLHILTLNAMRKWDEAKVKYEQYAKNNNIALSAEEAYSFLPKTKLKNPDKAEKISYFLPGIGQMYAGYFGKGLISSLIQAGLVGFGAYSLYEGYFFTGALTGIGLFYSFYTGGARHAKYLAMRKNEELTDKYNEPIKEAILESEMAK